MFATFVTGRYYRRDGGPEASGEAGALEAGRVEGWKGGEMEMGERMGEWRKDGWV
jgi:hypothetical protein